MTFSLRPSRWSSVGRPSLSARPWTGVNGGVGGSLSRSAAEDVQIHSPILIEERHADGASRGELAGGGEEGSVKGDAAPLVGVFNSSAELSDLLELALQEDGYRTVALFTYEVKRGQVDLDAF